MFWVKSNRFEVKESLYIGFKLIQILQIQDNWYICPKKSTFFDIYIYQLETDISRFLDPEYPNFDPKLGFISSMEAEIFTFLPNKAAIFIISI